jgi:anti-sigma factor RsiW
MTRPTQPHHTHSPRDPRCMEVFARLSEYLDGELDETDCRLIEEHIQGCEPCLEFLRSLRRSIEAAHHFSARVDPGKIPPELEARLKQAWQAALARRRAD